MHYVALLSGGKDSCFNLLHCAQHGHELLVAASLRPEPGKDEIDSYLYQTVGQDAIQLVADALEVPLVRRVIRGTAIQRDSEYGSRNILDKGVQGDETEDLFELLCEVKTKFPGIRGVSVGAILSNYQRVRVEHVCQRLSLTPLCYLWQRNQSELLSEMIDFGLEAILIKVAGIGLMTTHLGMTLAQMQPTLLSLNSLYGAHVCGEGGEYESLTLNSPLFKHRIILDKVETVIHSDSAFATVAFLKVTRAHLQRKPRCSVPKYPVLEPSMLSTVDEDVKEMVSRALSVEAINNVSKIPQAYLYLNTTSGDISCRSVGSLVVVSNVDSRPTAHLPIENEVRACFEIVQMQLAKYALDLSHVASITLLIASMDLYPAVNAVYALFFGVGPPARACVAVDLPSPIRIRLECIACAESRPPERRSLHVQSLSYWAPANIGPYSQAITVNRRVFVSGQIGLIPANNTLPAPRSLPMETALSLRHVRSIANAVKHISATPWDCTTQGVISWIASKSDITAVKSGMSVSKEFHSERAPTLFVVVKSLPKDALVETQVLLHTARQASEDDDTDLEMTSLFSRGELPGLETCWEVSSFKEGNASFAIVACTNNDDQNIVAERLTSVAALQSIWENAICVRIFFTPNASPDVQRLLNQLCGKDRIPCMAIPCRNLATWTKDHWDYALCIIA